MLCAIDARIIYLSIWFIKKLAKLLFILNDYYTIIFFFKNKLSLIFFPPRLCLRTFKRIVGHVIQNYAKSPIKIIFNIRIDDFSQQEMLFAPRSVKSN